MDIHCKFCGEPFDLDEFHDSAPENGTWSEWVSAFRTYGCGAANAFFDGETHQDCKECDSEPIMDDESIEGIGMIQELLGDDIDGACSMEEDFLRF